MTDSTAIKLGRGDDEGAMGVTTADRATYAKSQMWRAWAEFTDWRRRFEQLERQASEEFRAMAEAPAPSPAPSMYQTPTKQRSDDHEIYHHLDLLKMWMGKRQQPRPVPEMRCEGVTI